MRRAGSEVLVVRGVELGEPQANRFSSSPWLSIMKVFPSAPRKRAARGRSA